MSKIDEQKVDVLLPHKERFTPQNGGAVSTVVYELARHISAKSNQDITIFGSMIDAPKDGVSYQGLSYKKPFWQSRNACLAKAYLRYLQTNGRTPSLIEVHGRPQVAALIASSRPDLKVVLYLHNDPRTIKASKTVEQRKRLSQQLAGIISITEFVKGCFLEGLGDEDDYRAQHYVNLLGVERQKTRPKARQKQIFIAGRMVPEKGILEACQGAVPLLFDRPDWQIILAGGKDFTDTNINGSGLSAYERDIQRALAPLGARAITLGHQPLAAVKRLQAQSEICLVPSLWQEPGGLTVLEALSAGAALITTNRGGIPEFAKGRALIVDEPSPSAFQKALKALIDDAARRQELQDIAWQDFPFTAKKMSARAATFRHRLMT